jgi:WD40 repeat protein
LIPTPARIVKRFPFSTAIALLCIATFLAVFAFRAWPFAFRKWPWFEPKAPNPQASARLIHRFTIPESNGIWDFAVEPESRFAYLACEDGRIRQVNLESGSVSNLTPLRALSRKLYLDARQLKLIVGDDDGNVTCLDPTTGNEISTFRPYESRIYALAQIGNYAVVAGAPKSPTLILLSSDLHSKVDEIDEGFGVSIVAVSRDQSQLAMANCPQQQISVVDVRTHRRIASLAGHKRNGYRQEVTGLVFADDAKLISIGEDAVLKVWDTSSGNAVKEITASYSYLTAVAFSSASGMVATGDIDGRIQVWRWPTLEPLFSEEAHAYTPISQLQFTRSGKELISSCVGTNQHKQKRDGEIALWRVD